MNFLNGRTLATNDDAEALARLPRVHVPAPSRAVSFQRNTAVVKLVIVIYTVAVSLSNAHSLEVTSQGRGWLQGQVEAQVAQRNKKLSVSVPSVAGQIQDLVIPNSHYRIISHRQYRMQAVMPRVCVVVIDISKSYVPEHDKLYPWFASPNRGRACIPNASQNAHAHYI